MLTSIFEFRLCGPSILLDPNGSSGLPGLLSSLRQLSCCSATHLQLNLPNSFGSTWLLLQSFSFSHYFCPLVLAFGSWSRTFCGTWCSSEGHAERNLWSCIWMYHACTHEGLSKSQSIGQAAIRVVIMWKSRTLWKEIKTAGSTRNPMPERCTRKAKTLQCRTLVPKEHWVVSNKQPLWWILAAVLPIYC